MAGNIESHSTLNVTKILNITAVLDQEHYGFSKLSVVSPTELKWEFIRGDGGPIGDTLTLLKQGSTSTSTSTSTKTSASASTKTSASSSASSSGWTGW